MSIFRGYSNYYDLFYKDKDYSAETNFICSLIKKYAKASIKTILDLGCGTGGHAFLLAAKGYKVTGIDRSKDMLFIARKKLKKTKAQVSLIRADLRRFNLNKKFDAAVSMFAVIGYQVIGEDLKSTLLNIRRHLKPGSLFVFDIWFGPTVLAEKPEARIKEFKRGQIRTIRMVTPQLNPRRQIVTVKYDILEIRDKKVLAEVRESHTMRFFFIPELKLSLEDAGFKMIKVFPFMNASRQPRQGDWNISVIARAV
jgi:SAM-dependent methyltransferase